MSYHCTPQIKEFPFIIPLTIVQTPVLLTLLDEKDSYKIKDTFTLLC